MNPYEGTAWFNTARGLSCTRDTKTMIFIMGWRKEGPFQGELFNFTTAISWNGFLTEV